MTDLKKFLSKLSNLLKLQPRNLYEQRIPSSRPLPIDRGDADFSIGIAGPLLHEKARYIDANSDIGSGGLDHLESRVVGVSISSVPNVKRTDGTPATRLNERLKTLYKRWMRRPDSTGELPGGKFQRLAVRSLLRDGEFLCRRLEGLNFKHQNGIIPLSIELIERDRLPMDYSFPHLNIIQGIQKSSWGQPLFYYFYPAHPGSQNFSQLVPVRVPASDIVHSKLTKRIGQTRGVSKLHPVFNRTQDLHDIDLYERTATKQGAAIGLKIEKPIEAMGEPSKRNQVKEFFPGIVLDGLEPGEKAEMLNPNGRPNPQLVNFRHDQMRAMAAGFGVSFSALSNVFDGNYSAQRQDMVLNEGKIDINTSDFIETFIDPVYRWFIEAVFLYGLIDTSFLWDVDLETVFDVYHRGPSLPWIDPLKEVQANKISVEAGFKSQQQVIKQNGDDPDIIMQEISAERG